MEPNLNSPNRTLTVLFGIYLASHILLTSLQIYQTFYRDAPTTCTCSK